MAVITGTPNSETLPGFELQDDIISGLGGNDTLRGLGGNDTLDGGAGRDSLSGGAGSDSLIGGSESDILDGGAEADVMEGGSGDDTYDVDNSGDLVIEAANSGYDIVNTSLLSYTMPDNIEQLNLKFDGANYFRAFIGNGNNLDNFIQTLQNGTDQLYGHGGNDTLRGENGADYLSGGQGDDSLRGGADDDILDGGDDNDTLDGGGGNDVLDGGSGIDTAAFFTTRANYLIERINDTIRVTHINGGQDGIDRLTGIEFLRFTDMVLPVGNLPNAAPELVSSSPADNAFDVQAGANIVLTFDETVRAGAGSVRIQADNGSVVHTFAAATLVINGATVTIDPPQDLEAGRNHYITIDANAFVDVDGNPFAGISSNTVLNFTVAQPPTVTISRPVLASVAEGNATGGVLDFTISRTGDTSGSSTVMFTLGGAIDADNDIAQVQVNGQTITAASGVYTASLPAQVTDLIISVIAAGDLKPEADETVTVSLIGVRNGELGETTSASGVFTNDDAFPITLTGTGRADTLIGGANPETILGLESNDTLNGGGGNDTLDGGTGEDSMTGGTGDDTFIVDHARDSVIEATGGGFDTVRTSLGSLTLASNVEVLVYSGTGNFTGTGNALNNTITGGSAVDMLRGMDGHDRLEGLGNNDTLDGGRGNDTLDGGAGVDRLLGGSGNDTFVFDAADITGSNVVDGSAGFDAFAINGAAFVNTEGARVRGVEAVVVASTDTAAQTVVVNLDEVAAESTNGAGADANVFLALLGGGADTLDFTGTGWTQTASLQNVAAGAMLPSGAVRLSTAEAAIVNAIWGSQAIDPATGLGTAVGLDLYVFAKGAQIVTVWTDADTVI